MPSYMPVFNIAGYHVPGAPGTDTIDPAALGLRDCTNTLIDPLVTQIATCASLPIAATAVPNADGLLGQIGVSLNYAREDHTHPFSHSLTFSPARLLTYTHNGDVQSVTIPETLTSLTYAPLTNTLTYTDENGAVSNIVLPADRFLASASYDPNTNLLTLTLSDSSTVVVDLSDIIGSGNLTPGNSSVTVTGGTNALVANASVQVAVSAAVGNAIALNVDGLFVPAAAAQTPITANDSTSIDLTAFGIDNHTLIARLIVSPLSTNALTIQPDGVFVPNFASQFCAASTGAVPIGGSNVAHPNAYLGEDNTLYLSRPFTWMRVACAASPTGFVAIPAYQIP